MVPSNKSSALVTIAGGRGGGGHGGRDGGRRGRRWAVVVEMMAVVHHRDVTIVA